MSAKIGLMFFGWVYIFLASLVMIIALVLGIYYMIEPTATLLEEYFVTGQSVTIYGLLTFVPIASFGAILLGLAKLIDNTDDIKASLTSKETKK